MGTKDGPQGRGCKDVAFPKAPHPAAFLPPAVPLRSFPYMRTLLVGTVTLFLLHGSTALALDREPSDELSSLLEQSASADEEAGAHPWAYRSLLRGGFAHTPTIDRAIEELLAERVMRDPVWPETLEREAALARLQTRRLRKEDALAFDIPLADHPLVNVYIDYFTGRGRWFFKRWLARADRYIPLMQPILEAKGLPRDTVYLAMIESGFVSRAFSSAAASGFWQFIASTGRMYKLEQSTWVDERRDFIRATESAANYLNDLHREFGDWHLAWAGYNAGGGRIRRALQRYGVKDFWSLIKNPNALAKETRHYVPKIIAAAIVAKNREAYGFTDIESEAPLEFDEVQVSDAVSLQRVAQHLGVSQEELAVLNPALLYHLTPPGRTYTLRVPRGRGEDTATWLTSIPRSERFDFRQYVVRPGDTLWRIADRFRSTIATVKEFNGLGSTHHLRVGQRLIIPSWRNESAPAGTTGPRVASSRRSATSSSSATKQAPPRGRPTAKHVVAPGETLWSISQRYKTTVANIKAWNNRNSNQIGVGEVLSIF